jgi:hypothetical protein
MPDSSAAAPTGDTLANVVALPRRNRARSSEPTPAPEEADAFPEWAISSVLDFLGPFIRGEGRDADAYGDSRRSFLRELERNLRQPLDWRYGTRSALASLQQACDQDPSLLVATVDFALHNMMLGTYFQNYEAVAREFDRALRESGSVWRVGRIEGTVNYRLERRTDVAAGMALNRIAGLRARGGEHLTAAWEAAYGRDPNPSRAYSEAVKAVEDSAIPVVLPNDKVATLGKVIAALRQSPHGWHCVFARDTKLTPTMTATPIEVVIGMLDLLWSNQTDRHAPIQAVTQEQAESAVQLALALVEIFRSGAISKAP